MSSIKDFKYTLKTSTHHCQLILSYWCRLLNLDSRYTQLNICHTIISYRGPGDIVAFSSNARLSSIEIYNSITNCNIHKDDTAQQISANVCIKPVHIDMQFNSNSNKNDIIRTWHPALCSTFDYHYLYRIGGADPLKGLFGDSSANIEVFDMYSMTRISLPNMHYKRAKCSATLLPPTIPFHDYHDSDIEEDRSTLNLHNPALLQEILKPNLSAPRAVHELSPTPPAPTEAMRNNEKHKQNTPKTHQLPLSIAAPMPVLVTKLNERHRALSAPIPPAVYICAPIALEESTSSPTPSEAPNVAPLPALAMIGGLMGNDLAPIAPPMSILASDTRSKSLSFPLLSMSKSVSDCVVNYGGRSRKNTGIKERFVNGEYPEYCVFVSGGLNASKLNRKCEIFYPFEGSWNPVMNMKQARCGHIVQYMGATQWRNSWSSGKTSMSITEWKDISDLTTKVFVCGGRSQHGNGITSCECFDIETNKWKLCQRAPFTNHGYQSGCWLSNKQCVAMISGPVDGNRVALYRPNVNKWSVVGQQTMKNNMKRHNGMGLTHFYPLIGTLWLFGEEYLYIMGDDYKCKNLEIYDERNDKWIPIGISYNINSDDPSLTQKYDKLLHLTRHQQFDAFSSIS